jgi:hypothetical protein
MIPTINPWSTAKGFERVTYLKSLLKYGNSKWSKQLQQAKLSKQNLPNGENTILYVTKDKINVPR